MVTRRLYLFLLFLLLLLPGGVDAQVINLGPVKDHCASAEEVRLYNLISEYRRVHKLPVIPFSRSLSYVARVHAMDLQFNRPDFGGCNPHSWSDKGKWKACCYTRDKNRQLCMNEKPREIAGYRYKGWEMVYSGGEEAHAGDAFDLWKGLGLTNDYLLNTGKWIKPWKAIGIGFYGDYATVWFGEGDDTEKDFGGCATDTTASAKADEVANAATEETVLSETEIDMAGRFHIITGSLNSAEKAAAEVKRLKSTGYQSAMILPNGNMFRISVDNYATEADASQALPVLQQVFSGAWVLKPRQ